MDDFVRGPLVWISLLVCLAGTTYQAIRLYRLTRMKDSLFVAPRDKPQQPAPYPPEVQKLEQIARFQNSILGKHPVMTIVSGIFHFCLFVTPLFLVAHHLLLRQALHVQGITIPDRLADTLTTVLLACCVFFLVRRLMVPKVAALSSGIDYLLLLVTALPFLTGFMAYHQLFAYKHIILLHMLTGEIMLVVIPFTKLGHMVFFFIARFLISGEYALGRGNRTWSESMNG